MRSNRPRHAPRAVAAAATAMATAALALVGTVPAAAAPSPPVLIVDDFAYDAGLPAGVDANGVAIGYSTFAGAGSTVTPANPATPPAPANADNPAQGQVLELGFDVTSYAGVIHSFEDAAVGTWVTQDWSAYEGFTMWLYGEGSGTTLFVDLLENRNPGSTTDDAQRWTATVIDDVEGWRQVEIPFTAFTQKVVGNGAPTDDFERYEMHGWAIGALGTGGSRTFHVDDLGVYGVAPIPPLAVTFSSASYDLAEGATGDIAVRLNRPLLEDDPAEVSVAFATSPGTAVADREYTPTSGTLTFVQGGPRELTFPLSTFDDAKYEGDERVVLRLTDPSPGLAAGFTMVAAATLQDDDPYDALLLDDFETAPDLWRTSTGVELDTREIAAESPDALPGQGAYERVLAASAPEAGPTYRARVEAVVTDLRELRGESRGTDRWRIDRAIGALRPGLAASAWDDGFTLDHRRGAQVFQSLATAVRELAPVVRGERSPAAGAEAAIDRLVPVAGALATNAVDTAERTGAAAAAITAARAQLTRAEQELASGRVDRADDAIDRYRLAWVTATSATDAALRRGATPTPPSIGRDFAIGQDWTGADGLSFWYYGQDTGAQVGVELLDNRAPDPGTSGWSLAWSDEFDTPAGTAPDPDTWGFEIGDGTANGIPGWGNDELQYYTDSTDNAATDGAGNLVITARASDGSLQCYYGPCDYTSARLLSANKAEFAYGRIESRIQVPSGQDGLWPAFWSLGTDIGRVGWPQTGEIDIMEYVSRIPDEVFGTIHGPGYSGGSSFGSIQNIPDLAAEYHTYAIEWTPDRIEWFVDDIRYHTATPADVAPNQWVFNDPVYLLLNMAIGGNFGGAVSPDLTFPQEMKVDYVRVYQGPHTAERFEASFVDDTAGWRQVTVPFSDFARSDVQPDGAPDDGLGLDQVWGYGFRMPQEVAGAVGPDGSGGERTWFRWWPRPPAHQGAGSLLLDQVRLVDTTPPTATVTDDVDAELATGDVTFTFAFSEDVGTSFSTDDVVLTGGVKGAFTRLDGRRATLVAKPPADASGTLAVSVAAGAVADLAGNVTAAAVTAEQAYRTPPAPTGGLVVSFDEAVAPVLTGFGGAEDSQVVADPADPENLVARVVKAEGAQVWAGTTVSTQPGLTVPVIPFAAGATVMTARVFSPEAGVPVRLKVESAVDGSRSVETEAVTTLAGGWETLAFDFAVPAAGTPALDLATSYDKVSIFFDFGTAGTGATYYLDDLTWP